MISHPLSAANVALLTTLVIFLSSLFHLRRALSHALLYTRLRALIYGPIILRRYPKTSRGIPLRESMQCILNAQQFHFSYIVAYYRVNVSRRVVLRKVTLFSADYLDAEYIIACERQRVSRAASSIETAIKFGLTLDNLRGR